MLLDITSYEALGLHRITSFCEKSMLAELLRKTKETSIDEEFPEPLYRESAGKSSPRVDFNCNYNAEEREHYKKIQKYRLHQPWPLKAGTQLTQTKDVDNWDGGFGNAF